MEATPQVLVVGSDPLLKQEFEAAVTSLQRWRAILQFVRGPAQALEVVHKCRPVLVCIQLEDDPDWLEAFVEFASKVEAEAPDTRVVPLRGPKERARIEEGTGAGRREVTLIIGGRHHQVHAVLDRPITGDLLQRQLDVALRETRKEKPRRKFVDVRREAGPGLAIIVDRSVDRDALANFLGSLAGLYGDLSRGDELVVRDGRTFAPLGAKVLT